MDLRQSLQVITRTGSLVVGYRETMRKVMQKKAVAVVASTHSSPELLARLRIVAKAFDVPVIVTELTPAELGLALRKPFSTSFIAVLDAGSSDILDHVRSETAWAKE
ncbi:MAG: ribosomal L7Ae/L30e/S12e/Gadd45 family protein [Candidatus Caldarchaeum sp.]|jgi:large subunit ribosomal protein L30e